MSKETNGGRLRVTLDLEVKDVEILTQLTGANEGMRSKAHMIRKAIKILAAIKNEESFLCTPTGDRIPNSVIFS